MIDDDDLKVSLGVNPDQLKRIEEKMNALMDDPEGDLDLANLIAVMTISHYYMSAKLKSIEHLLQDSMNEYWPVPTWASKKIKDILEDA